MKYIHYWYETSQSKNRDREEKEREEDRRLFMFFEGVTYYVTIKIIFIEEYSEHVINVND